MSMMNRLLNLLAIAFMAAPIVGCSGPSSDSGAGAEQPEVVSQDIAALAKSYQDLVLMTPKPVYVNPELAMLCIGATKEMVEEARIENGPHANCAVKIFMNELASTAFNLDTPFPAGAVIVKEKRKLGYRTKTDPAWQGTGSGVGGMIKRHSGYDVQNGDWEYFYFDDPSSIESGKMVNCIECHRKAQSSDFVFADWAKTDSENNYSY